MNSQNKSSQKPDRSSQESKRELPPVSLPAVLNWREKPPEWWLEKKRRYDEWLEKRKKLLDQQSESSE